MTQEQFAEVVERCAEVVERCANNLYAWGYVDASTMSIVVMQGIANYLEEEVYLSEDAYLYTKEKALERAVDGEEFIVFIPKKDD